MRLAAVDADDVDVDDVDADDVDADDADSSALSDDWCDWQHPFELDHLAIFEYSPCRQHARPPLAPHKELVPVDLHFSTFHQVT